MYFGIDTKGKYDKRYAIKQACKVDYIIIDEVSMMSYVGLGFCYFIFFAYSRFISIINHFWNRGKSSRSIHRNSRSFSLLLSPSAPLPLDTEFKVLVKIEEVV